MPNISETSVSDSSLSPAWSVMIILSLYLAHRSKSLCHLSRDARIGRSSVPVQRLGRMIEGAVCGARCGSGLGFVAFRLRLLGLFDVNCLAAAGEFVQNAPPESGCRVVIGQRCFGCCRLNGTARVEACAIQVLQPLRQAQRERVFDQVRYQLGEQFRPLLILRRVASAESRVEPVLPCSGEKTSLLRPSWPQAGWLDLHRGAPNLKVGDQASRQYAILFVRPGHSFAGRADLIS
jgi:hypothetical protein